MIDKPAVSWTADIENSRWVAGYASATMGVMDDAEKHEFWARFEALPEKRKQELQSLFAGVAVPNTSSCFSL